MLKLKRLRVERFRSLVKGTELSFSDGINVVLGQNGTGKTTLLELISMVVRSDFSSLATEEFAIEYELAVPNGESIVVVVRNTRIELESQQTLVDLGTREVFRPSGEMFDGKSRHSLVRYDAEHGRTQSNKVSEGTTSSISPLQRGFVIYHLPSTDRFMKLATRLFFDTCNTLRLDESLDLFRQIVAPGELPGNIMGSAERGWFPDPLAPSLFPESILENASNLLSDRQET